jgi:hypothetical protein
VLLALVRGIGDEVGVVEPLGRGQYGARHVDIVIEGEHADDALRRVVHWGKPARELGAGLGLNRRDELEDDLVEQVDLARRVVTGAFNEEIGDAREHGDALRVGAGGERTLELVDQRLGGAHGRLCSYLPPCSQNDEETIAARQRAD